jgi:uncharacterized membrane protein
MIDRARLDAMTDGVFGFAMTLLVITLDVPDGYDPADSRSHLAFLASLGDALFAYLISFFVLGVQWTKLAARREGPDAVSPAEVWVRLAGLFLVTLMPFSTVLLARYGDFWPSFWVYSANLVASGCLNLWGAHLAARRRGEWVPAAEKIDTGVLVATALLAAAVSLVSPPLAIFAYVLNAAGPLLARIATQRSA